MLVHKDLFQVLRGFASLSPPHTIDFPVYLEPLGIHQFLLENILLDPHLQAYPPSRQYQYSFWKWAIRHLERSLAAEDDEIDSRIYDHYLSLMPSAGPALGLPQPYVRELLCPRGLPLQPPPAESYVTHYWKPISTGAPLGSDMVDLAQHRTVTLLESRTVIESGTTGLRTWLASFVLSQYLTNNPELVVNKRILELGSGVGFLGIIVASLQLLSPTGPQSSVVHLTDINKAVLNRCTHNLRLPCNLSSNHPRTKCQPLDWFAAVDPDQQCAVDAHLQEDVDPDLILGADIVFDPDLIPSLVGVLRLALHPGHNRRTRTALIALTQRNEGTIATFLASVKRFLLLEEVDYSFDGPTCTGDVDGVDALQNVKIYRISFQPWT